MAEVLRAQLPKPATKAQFAEYLADDSIDPTSARIVWSVGSKALVQRVDQFDVPLGPDLKPVRRIGTYPGAANRIGMYPVVRDGMTLMLELESRLELAHVRRLDIDAGVDWIHAQPCLLYWTVGERGVYMVPDLLYHDLLASTWVVADVKSDEAVSRDPHARAKFELAATSIAAAGAAYRILGSLTPQAKVNLQVITRYRQVNPHLLGELGTAWYAKPTFVGSLLDVVGDTFGRDILMTLLANGLCSIDLDSPIRESSRLTWVDTIEVDQR